MNQPEILMADEPVSDLDEQTEDELLEMFSRIHRGFGITVLLATHSQQLVRNGTRAIRKAGAMLVELVEPTLSGWGRAPEATRRQSVPSDHLSYE